MYKESKFKVANWDELWAAMGVACSVPCNGTVEGMGWRLWMLAMLTLPEGKRRGDTRPDRGLRYVGRGPLGVGDAYEVVEPFHDLRKPVGWLWDNLRPGTDWAIADTGLVKRMQAAIDAANLVKLCWADGRFTRPVGTPEGGPLTDPDASIAISVDLPADLKTSEGLVANMRYLDLDGTQRIQQ